VTSEPWFHEVVMQRLQLLVLPEQNWRLVRLEFEVLQELQLEWQHERAQRLQIHLAYEFFRQHLFRELLLNQFQHQRQSCELVG
jgi:hypothetical protein